jgi:hypothetical protein
MGSDEIFVRDIEFAGSILKVISNFRFLEPWNYFEHKFAVNC